MVPEAAKSELPAVPFTLCSAIWLLLKVAVPLLMRRPWGRSGLR